MDFFKFFVVLLICFTCLFSSSCSKEDASNSIEGSYVGYMHLKRTDRAQRPTIRENNIFLDTIQVELNAMEDQLIVSSAPDGYDLNHIYTPQPQDSLNTNSLLYLGEPAEEKWYHELSLDDMTNHLRIDYKYRKGSPVLDPDFMEKEAVFVGWPIEQFNNYDFRDDLEGIYVGEFHFLYENNSSDIYIDTTYLDTVQVQVINFKTIEVSGVEKSCCDLNGSFYLPISLKQSTEYRTTSDGASLGSQGDGHNLTFVPSQNQLSFKYNDWNGASGEYNLTRIDYIGFKVE